MVALQRLINSSAPLGAGHDHTPHCGSRNGNIRVAYASREQESRDRIVGPVWRDGIVDFEVVNLSHHPVAAQLAVSKSSSDSAADKPHPMAERWSPKGHLFL